MQHTDNDDAFVAVSKINHVALATQLEIRGKSFANGAHGSRILAKRVYGGNQLRTIFVRLRQPPPFVGECPNRIDFALRTLRDFYAARDAYLSLALWMISSIV